MYQEQLPDWESDLIEDAIRDAETRRKDEKARAKKRALQLAREQGYHRLAVAIDRPGNGHSGKGRPGKGQLRLFPVEDQLFDDGSA